MIVDREQVPGNPAQFVFEDGTRIPVEQTEQFLKKVEAVGLDNIVLTEQARWQVVSDKETYSEWDNAAHGDYLEGHSGDPNRFIDFIMLLHLLLLPAGERLRAFREIGE